MSRTKEIEIKVEGTEWEEAMDKAYEKANQKVKIDGFRPGKAPKDVFLKKIKVKHICHIRHILKI